MHGLSLRPARSRRTAGAIAALVLALGAGDVAVLAPLSHAATPPGLSKISVTSGPTRGGTVVTLSGKNFTKITKVTFGGTSAAFKLNSSTKITVTAPAHKAGAVDVRVVGRNGTSKIVSAGRYGYVSAPTISSISPAAGTDLGGTAVTVTGRDFRNVTAVTFGGTKATAFRVSSSTRLVATAPRRGAGTATVQVLTRYGSSASTSGSRFTFQSVPVVTTGSLPVASAGLPYAAQLAATKGIKPYRWSASGLPNGLKLGSDGRLSGLVTTAPTAKTSGRVTITVVDAKNVRTSRTLTLTVQPSLPKIAGSLGEASVGLAYHAQLITTDGRAGSWSAAATLPSGLSLHGSVLSGTITTAGSYPISLRFTDLAGQRVTTVVTLTVSKPTGPGGMQDLAYCNRTVRFDETDTATTAIDLPSGIDIDFGGKQKSFFISPNGYITFGSGSATASPFALEDFPQPVIAPFLADADTTVGSPSTVTWGYSGTQLCVTWKAMSYWQGGTDKQNTFQLILTARPERGNGAFDITFNYGRIQWDAGASDGGVQGRAPLGFLAARAGWSTGLLSSDERTRELPGSAMGGALVDGGLQSLVSGSTNGTPGRYTFGIG